MDTRRSPLSSLRETGGNRYASIMLAQEMALKEIAQDVAQVIREGLATGQLVVDEGWVRFTENSDGKA